MYMKSKGYKEKKKNMRKAYATSMEAGELPKEQIAAQRRPWAEACKENKGLNKMIARQEAKLSKQAAVIKTRDESIQTEQKEHVQSYAEEMYLGWMENHIVEYESFTKNFTNRLYTDRLPLPGQDRLEWKDS